MIAVDQYTVLYKADCCSDTPTTPRAARPRAHTYGLRYAGAAARAAPHRDPPRLREKGAETTAKKIASDHRCRRAPGAKNTREVAGCGCGLEVDPRTRPLWMRWSARPSGRDWRRLKGTQLTGPERGHERQSEHESLSMRRNGGEFEALGLLCTFVGCPTAAQWAVAGEAPAPRLTDRSRPRPQRGNSRGRQREERAAATRRSDRDCPHLRLPAAAAHCVRSTRSPARPVPRWPIDLQR